MTHQQVGRSERQEEIVRFGFLIKRAIAATLVVLFDRLASGGRARASSGGALPSL